MAYCSPVPGPSRRAAAIRLSFRSGLSAFQELGIGKRVMLEAVAKNMAVSAKERNDSWACRHPTDLQVLCCVDGGSLVTHNMIFDTKPHFVATLTSHSLNLNMRLSASVRAANLVLQDLHERPLAELRICPHQPPDASRSNQFYFVINSYHSVSICRHGRYYTIVIGPCAPVAAGTSASIRVL